MNKREFLAALGASLEGMPSEDVSKTLDYYSEMLDDCIENGATEEQAVASMGSIDGIVSQILMDTPLPKLIKEKAKKRRSPKAWEVVLIIIGSPLWAPLLLAAVAIVLALYVVLWALVISLWAITVALGIVGIAVIPTSFFISGGNAFSTIFTCGAGITAIGLSILLFLASRAATLGAVRLVKAIVLRIKTRVISKEAEK